MNMDDAAMTWLRGASTVFLILFFLFLTLPSSFAQEGKEASISVGVERMESSASVQTIIIMAVFFLALLALFFMLLRYLLLEKRKKSALVEKAERMGGMDKDEAEYFKDNPEDFEEKISRHLSADEGLDRYLKEDEKKVVTILRQREGICSQSTLRVVGDFSKATLSRLLTELEQRNIIKKEKRGKKNLVILK